MIRNMQTSVFFPVSGKTQFSVRNTCVGTPRSNLSVFMLEVKRRMVRKFRKLGHSSQS